MGSKLPLEDAIIYHEALKKFEKKFGINSKASIWVSKDGKEIFAFSDVTVIVHHGTYASDLYEINIVWEDAGVKDYRALGLYVVYSSEYCPMKFVRGRLVIQGNEGMVLEIG